MKCQVLLGKLKRKRLEHSAERIANDKNRQLQVIFRKESEMSGKFPID
jgi:hypothetical protein